MNTAAPTLNKITTATRSSSQDAPVDNPWLQGRFAPVTQERCDTELRVSGQIPDALNGMYARIGPNPIKVKNPRNYHWFLGDGMVHGVRLAEGQAQWYRNRWVGTDSVHRQLGRPKVEGPRRFTPVDSVNTNVIGHAGRIFALVEAGPLPAELDWDLQTLRRGLFDGPGKAAFSAHPHLDPLTGELHAICYDALRPRRIAHVAIDADCRIKRIEPIPVRNGPMIHDCAITASSVVVLDLPVTFSWKRIFTGASFPYAWNEQHAARVGLLPKEGDAQSIRWFEVDPCYVFHTCNAYDLPDGGAVLDVVVHQRMFDRSRQGPEGDLPATFERWTLNAQSGRVERGVLSEQFQEFPRYDERLTGQTYRYGYTTGVKQNAPEQPLYRHDLVSGAVARHEFGANRVPGEFVFVPDPGRGDEDAGWLMGYVHHLDSEATDLVLLNAQDFSGEPQATVHLPVRVPMGFHGNWIARS